MNGNQSTQALLKLQASNHAIIVLASGLSQRLGQAKQLLYKDGEPLIRYMTKLAVATKPQVIIMVIPDNNPAIIKAMDELNCQYSAIQIVVNPSPETGMAHSLYLGIDTLIGLTNLSIERVLIMGIDQILLDEPHLMALLAGKEAVVASGYHNWQDLYETNTKDALKKDIVGLPLAINYKLLKKWQSALVGDKGLRHLIRGLPPNQINTMVNNQLSYDIDIPAQLSYAKQRGWLDEQS